MTKAERDIRRKLRVLNYPQKIRNISKTRRFLAITAKVIMSGNRPMPSMEKKGKQLQALP
jgi:hypothetical protein